MRASVVESGQQLTHLQQLIVDYLRRRSASYARPVPSSEISTALRISWTYARQQAHELVKRGLLAVRVGPGGGYFLAPEAAPVSGERAMEPGANGPAASRDAAQSDICELVDDLQAVVAELSTLVQALRSEALPGEGVGGPSHAARAQAERVLEALHRLRRAAETVRAATAEPARIPE